MPLSDSLPACAAALQYDFPEELSSLQRMGRDAGFSSVRTVFEASKGLSAVVVFQA